MRAWLGVMFGVAACGFPKPADVGDDAGGTPKDASVDAETDAMLDADVDAPPAGPCDPLTQTGCAAGEKCTWLVDALMPQHVGHVGCAPDGAVQADQSCTYGAPGVTGYDNCVKGLVCSNLTGGTGFCRTICDTQGSAVSCDSNHTCAAYADWFSEPSMPPAAGLCDPTCDPLAANDFDGSGTTFTRSSNICGAADRGCYGYPSNGNPPATTFTCAADIHYTAASPGLRHRVQCTMANGCMDGTNIYINSCNQGYEPLLRESTGSTTVVCVALCKPLNCYSGNCGTNANNRLGALPHNCTTSSAVGTFNSSSTSGEHCHYFWSLEVDGTNANLLRSPYSDTLGLCFDHSKYQYDSNGDQTPDTAYPACKDLQVMGTSMDPSNPLTYFGAIDFGCVDTTTAGIQFSGKPHIDPKRHAMLWGDIRPLYSRIVGSP